MERTGALRLEALAPEEMPDPAEWLLAQRVVAELHRHYPAHPWVVAPDLRGGIVTISLCYPDRPWERKSFGYVVKLADIQAQYGFERTVMRAGGECLERWKLRRGGGYAGAWQEARQAGLDKGAA